MKIVIAAAVVLSLAISNAFAASQDDAFQKVAHDYVEQYLQANPEQATELGDHRFDGELTDYSPEARAKDLSTQKEVSREVECDRRIAAHRREPR